MSVHVWEAWVGQKIARMESHESATIIICEDGRGILLDAYPAEYFYVKDINGPIFQFSARTVVPGNSQIIPVANT